MLRLAVVASVLLAAPAVRAGVLDENREPLAFGVGLGVGYSSTTVAEGESAGLVPAELSVAGILWQHWEARLELRADFDPARPAAPVRTYSGLLWLVADLDLLPVVVFVGAGGGAVFDGADPRIVAGTAGGCVGLALWLAQHWRLSVRGAERWVFDAVGAMPLEVFATGEYFW